jgi:hypothetical protein
MLAGTRFHVESAAGRPDMLLNLVHLDEALAGQPEFLAAAAALGAREVDEREAGSQVRLWAGSEDFAAFGARLAAAVGDTSDRAPAVTWLGSGDFHHVSAILVALAAKRCPAPLTVVAFDNHPDWVAFRSGVHCGSWVRHVLDLGTVARVVGIGMTSRDLVWPEFKGAGLGHVASGKLVLFPLSETSSFVMGDYGQGPGHGQRGRRVHWTSAPGLCAAANSSSVIDAIQTEAIYITIDKDVLSGGEAATNWDQGRLSLEELLSWLRLLASRFKVAGVDVCGDYSIPRFRGSMLSRALKRSEILIDHPRKPRDPAATQRINQRANLAILKTLEETLC